MASDLDAKIVIAGEQMTMRDLVTGQFRLMVFSAIQHADEEFRKGCIEVVRDAHKCVPVFEHTHQSNASPRD
jgi:hypothetical protein